MYSNKVGNGSLIKQMKTLKDFRLLHKTGKIREIAAKPVEKMVLRRPLQFFLSLIPEVFTPYPSVPPGCLVEMGPQLNK